MGPFKSQLCLLGRAPEGTDYSRTWDLNPNMQYEPGTILRTNPAPSQPSYPCFTFFLPELQNEEEPGEAEQAVNDAPPPYSSISAESAAYFDYKDESGFPKPPSYNVATTLPTYDEAERTKVEATIPLVPGRDDDFVARDDFDDADQLRIGNDGIFMLTFFMAFLFNWIGFFLSFCLTTSAAGRYGAISGFGLSLIKWILIVRFSTYFPGYFDGQYWLWWVFLVLGFLLFLRGFINYAKVRKMPDTFSTLPRTRVLFIY
uniref:Nedd4 family interacting protein 1 n=2 Tax=Ornithorhynchus anatinus TaxID=9258 RepID=A0A6I8NFZ8_ORNAN